MPKICSVLPYCPDYKLQMVAQATTLSCKAQVLTSELHALEAESGAAFAEDVPHHLPGMNYMPQSCIVLPYCPWNNQEVVAP